MCIRDSSKLRCRSLGRRKGSMTDVNFVLSASFHLVPKLCLGTRDWTKLSFAWRECLRDGALRVPPAERTRRAKCNFAPIGIPKLNLGTSAVTEAAHPCASNAERIAASRPYQWGCKRTYSPC